MAEGTELRSDAVNSAPCNSGKTCEPGAEAKRWELSIYDQEESDLFSCHGLRAGRAGIGEMKHQSKRREVFLELKTWVRKRSPDAGWDYFKGHLRILRIERKTMFQCVSSWHGLVSRRLCGRRQGNHPPRVKGISPKVLSFLRERVKHRVQKPAVSEADPARETLRPNENEMHQKEGFQKRDVQPARISDDEKETASNLNSCRYEERVLETEVLLATGGTKEQGLSLQTTQRTPQRR